MITKFGKEATDDPEYGGPFLELGFGSSTFKLLFSVNLFNRQIAIGTALDRSTYEPRYYERTIVCDLYLVGLYLQFMRFCCRHYYPSPIAS